MKQVMVFFGSLGTLLVGSCECQRTSSQARAYPARTGPVIYSSDQVELDEIREFYKRVFGIDGYSRNWAELDRYRSGSAGTARVPYQDSWYPERSGGTNVAGALAKYDRAFSGGQNKAAQWEKDNHSRQQPNWYGHCNGTSAAGARFQSPTRSTTRPKGCSVGTLGCVEFTPADIRALLSELGMNAKAKFISGNRCRLTAAEIAKRPTLRANPLVMDDCDDVNPGTFHAGLVNFLGKMRQPIVFDENQDEQVWNYLIYAYDYTSQILSESAATSALRTSVQNLTGGSDFPAGNSWIFNPNAKSFVRVVLNVYYRKTTFDFQGAGSKPDPARRSYQYILELDEAGDVIGGEWMGSSRNTHPDFIWMAFEPAEPSGDDTRGNPNVSNLEVIKLWADAMGFNPEDPFRDKPKNSYDVRFFPPSTDQTWGVVPGYYRLELDGRQTGSLFLGKKSLLRIVGSEAIKNDAVVEIQLNGQVLQSAPMKDGKVDVVFESPPGLNLLNLRWTSSRVDSNELNWDFRYYAM